MLVIGLAALVLVIGALLAAAERAHLRGRALRAVAAAAAGALLGYAALLAFLLGSMR
ncbi:hypothetical protein [Nonomuraea ceibae]|uniref:hypothetical protein n=1 Tax=Nonomuraea ceibae TaxID=1935170 RepID=UPI001C5FBC28|nr:hypothetical protein [Nonomuraea ceibae]